jgi:hypothetical protein
VIGLQVCGSTGNVAALSDVFGSNAGRFRVTAGHQRGATRVGVRGVGGCRVGVLDAGVGQLGKRRARVVGDVPVKVTLVHAIDRDQIPGVE